MTIDAQTAYDDAQAQEAQVTGDEIRDRHAEQAHDDAAAEEAYEGTDVSDHELGLTYLGVKEKIENLQLTLRPLESAIRNRIEATGGTALPDDEIEMKLEPGKIVDIEPLEFVPLKEIFTDDDLKAVFTKEHNIDVPEQVIPAHAEYVPEKWANLVKLNTMARRYGDAALAHVARAGIRSDPKLVVARRRA